MSYTLANLRSYCNSHGYRDVSSTGATDCNTFINNMIQRLAGMRAWPAYLKSFYIGLTAPYTTGTVTLAASATVEGSGTTWASAMAGQEFYTATDSGRLYQIASVTDSDTLVLEQSYAGITGSAKTYSLRYVRYNLPSDFGDIAGGIYDEDGIELSCQQVSLDRWHQLRLTSRDTAGIPSYVAIERGGPSQAGTCHLFVHPAPSAARLLRGTYQAVPVTATASAAPDWPERLLYLLHSLLRIEIATQDGGRGSQVEYEKLERSVEQAYQKEVQAHGPVEIVPRARQNIFQYAADSMRGIIIE